MMSGIKGTKAGSQKFLNGLKEIDTAIKERQEAAPEAGAKEVYAQVKAVAEYVHGRDDNRTHEQLATRQWTGEREAAVSQTVMVPMEEEEANGASLVFAHTPAIARSGNKTGVLVGLLSQGADTREAALIGRFYIGYDTEDETMVNWDESQGRKVVDITPDLDDGNSSIFEADESGTPQLKADVDDRLAFLLDAIERGADHFVPKPPEEATE